MLAESRAKIFSEFSLPQSLRKIAGRDRLFGGRIDAPLLSGNGLCFSVTTQEWAKTSGSGRSKIKPVFANELPVWAGILSGIQSEAFSPAWESTSLRSAITCATATSTLPTNTCKRLRTPSVLQGKLVDAILPTGLLSASKSTLIQ
jgi:hypothetical protein